MSNGGFLTEKSIHCKVENCFSLSLSSFSSEPPSVIIVWKCVFCLGLGFDKLLLKIANQNCLYVLSYSIRIPLSCMISSSKSKQIMRRIPPLTASATAQKSKTNREPAAAAAAAAMEESALYSPFHSSLSSSAHEILFVCYRVVQRKTPVFPSLPSPYKNQLAAVERPLFSLLLFSILLLPHVPPRQRRE